MEELEDKRNNLNSKAEGYKAQREKFNAETKKLAERRDSLNDKVKNLIKDASEHRKKRDDINIKVKDAKALREKLNREYNATSEEVNRLKKEKLPKGGVPLGKLRAELKKIEFKQMTSVLTSDKERELVDMLSQLQGEIREREKLLEKNTEIQSSMKKLKESKEKAEEQHRLVSTLADQAQQEHESMVTLFEESDKLRREADAAQEKFIEAKLKADEQHKNHILFIKQVRELDKIISGLRRKRRKAKVSKSKTQAKKEATEIYERFKAGEKLSTEDLMALQKAGYL
ncbi:MAG: phosphoserine phosphatase [Thermoplasmata archaeon]|nr:MAG: phosphoserine phosphatase [Thermoplasmata archaeon]